MKPSGCFGDKACGLLLTMANPAFRADRSAKGCWLTTWRNCLVATAVQGAALLNFQTRVHALHSSNFRIYDTFITISSHQKMV